MIARVVAYHTESLDASRAWIRERADMIRSVEGIVRFEVVSQRNPDLAGGIVYFDSREAWERYREKRLPGMQESIASAWGKGMAFEQVFEVEETLVPTSS